MNATNRAPVASILRPARATDSSVLFMWNNALRSCNLALSGSEPIERAAHEAWFVSRLNDLDCRICIVEYAGKSVGMVRLEGEAEDAGETVAVSVYIAREARRTGLASAAIERALHEAAHERGALTAIARVRPENTASRRLFEGLGFTAADRRADHLVLRRRVPE